MIVLLGHCFIRMSNLTDGISLFGHDATWLFRPYATIGMYIFFTLSGYLMGNQFFEDKYALTTKGIFSFFRARLMRIVPLFYFLTMFYLIYDGADFLRDFHPNQLAKILTFTYNIWPFEWSGDHFWSIATEMQFYLVVPALFFVCKRFCKNGFALTASLVVGLGFLEFYRAQLFPSALFPNGGLNMAVYQKKIYYPLIGNLDVFFVGFWLNMFYHWQSGSGTSSAIKRNCQRLVIKLQNSNCTWFGWLAIAGCYVATTLMYCSDLQFFHMRFGIFNLLTAVATAILIVTARGAETNIKNAKLNFDACKKNPVRLLDCIGVLSYGIYLWHVSLMVYAYAIFVKANTVRDYLVLVSTTMILAVAFATVTYLGLERPVNQLRYKLASK